jgi:hypothetical protein
MASDALGVACALLKAAENKALDASMSVSDADSSHSLNSFEYKPMEDTPSRLKLATYPDVTICRSSTTIYMLGPQPVSYKLLTHYNEHFAVSSPYWTFTLLIRQLETMPVRLKGQYVLRQRITRGKVNRY